MQFKCKKYNLFTIMKAAAGFIIEMYLYLCTQAMYG